MDPEETKQIISGFECARIVEIDRQHWPLNERPDEVRTAIKVWRDDLTAPVACPLFD